MIREKAFKLAGEVADAGFAVTVGVDPESRPRMPEYCSVTVRSSGRPLSQLLPLDGIGERHGCELRLSDGKLTYFEKAGA